MPSTVIPFGDPKAQKKWGAGLAMDTLAKNYFTRKFVGKDDNSIIQEKTELVGEAGDRISFDLSVQLRGEPTEGDARLEGKEENLRFYTDEVIIDQTRKSVSAGGRMSRKRSVHDTRKVGKSRLSDYWSKYIDELYFIYLSGARGINEDFIRGTDFAGFAGNAVEAPDSQHIMFGGDAVSKATITANDVMNRTVIEKACTKARMMRAYDPDTANMMPVKIKGGEHYVCVMSPTQEQDMRTAEGAGGWLEVQKAAAAAEGKASKIFIGGLGMINSTILHSHESVIRFDDAGVGNDVPSARSLFMGRQAGVCAYGTPKGSRFSWKEKLHDYDNEPTIAAGTIIGIKKTRYNGKDFGVMAIDTAAAPPE